MSYVDMSVQCITQETHERYAYTEPTSSHSNLVIPALGLTFCTPLFRRTNQLRSSIAIIVRIQLFIVLLRAQAKLAYLCSLCTMHPCPQQGHFLNIENAWTAVKDGFRYRGYEKKDCFIVYLNFFIAFRKKNTVKKTFFFPLLCVPYTIKCVTN